MKILVTGLTGLVGSRFQELLDNAYEFDQITKSVGVDILDKDSVSDKISSSDCDLVLHLAAKTNVDACEDDKIKDKEILGLKTEEEQEHAFKREKTAWGVNVFGTQNIVNACEEFDKKLIFVSTDFVFNGQKKTYDEEEVPDPVNWYGKTKFEAEKVIQESNLDFVIARIAYPYRSIFERNDFVRAIISRLEKGETVNAITDHIMVPTFIDDLVNAIDVLIQTDQSGLFHVVGSESITPFNAALTIAEEFGFNSSLIQKTTRREYFMDKAPRPFCLNLKNDKIGRLGIEMSTFDQGIKEVKNQLERIHI